MSEEEAQKIKENNDDIRRNRDEVAGQIASKFATFKRDFMSAPIRRAMKAVLAGTGDQVKPCQIDYRKKERYWVFPSKTDVSVTMEVDFSTKTD